MRSLPFNTAASRCACRGCRDRRRAWLPPEVDVPRNRRHWVPGFRTDRGFLHSLTPTRAGRLDDASVDHTDARKSAALKHPPIPEKTVVLGNSEKRLRIRDCDERTLRISCRAGCNDFDPRRTKMPARSTVSARSALRIGNVPSSLSLRAAPWEVTVSAGSWIRDFND
jgi:hypothetical protein